MRQFATSRARDGRTTPLGYTKGHFLVGLLVLALGGIVFLTAQWLAALERVNRLEGQAKASTSESCPQIEGPRVHPGISPEIDTLLNAPEAELAEADVVELNLLVAKGLPECSDIDIAACKRRLDRWADEVRLLLAQDPQGFENNREKWKTRRRFELAVMGSVLKDDHGVRYVDKINHGDPSHKFALGIFKDGTGTCASLPVVWAALGRRLGHPISMAVAPEHLYCICDDGSEKINIEASTPRLWHEAAIQDDVRVRLQEERKEHPESRLVVRLAVRARRRCRE